MLLGRLDCCSGGLKQNSLSQILGRRSSLGFVGGAVLSARLLMVAAPNEQSLRYAQATNRQPGVPRAQQAGQ